MPTTLCKPRTRPKGQRRVHCSLVSRTPSRSRSLWRRSRLVAEGRARFNHCRPHTVAQTETQPRDRGLDAVGRFGDGPAGIRPHPGRNNRRTDYEAPQQHEGEVTSGCTAASPHSTNAEIGRCFFCASPILIMALRSADPLRDCALAPSRPSPLYARCISSNALTTASFKRHPADKSRSYCHRYQNRH
jgi:hypothetical protein